MRVLNRLMFDWLTPNAKQVRTTQRRLLFALFCVAVALTLAKYFYDRARLSDRPLEWEHELSAEAIERDWKAGRSYLVLLTLPDDPATQDWLDALETPAVRKQIRLLDVTTVQIKLPVRKLSREPTLDSAANSQSDTEAYNLGDWEFSQPMVIILLSSEEEVYRFEEVDRTALEDFLRQARIRLSS